MTWTFDATDLSTNLAKVRQTIGDTVTARQLLTDEQIDFRLDQYDDDIDKASIRCIMDILALLTQSNFDRSNVGMSASRSQLITNYQEVLKQLRSESSSLAQAFVGGLSSSTESGFDDSDDYKGPDFRLGMDDKP